MSYYYESIKFTLIYYGLFLHDDWHTRIFSFSIRASFCITNQAECAYMSIINYNCIRCNNINFWMWSGHEKVVTGCWVLWLNIWHKSALIIPLKHGFVTKNIETEVVCHRKHLRISTTKTHLHHLSHFPHALYIFRLSYPALFDHSLAFNKHLVTANPTYQEDTMEFLKISSINQKRSVRNPTGNN